MTISFSKRFIKRSEQLPPALRKKLQQIVHLFFQDSHQPTLRNHALQGKFRGYRSIDITGDLGALYLEHDNRVIFDLLGTHSQLYG
jgi:addiction module RelE/StbE family toxin